MKKAVLTILLLVYSVAARGEGASREQLVREALEDYGKVAGAWFLNVRCSFLVGTELEEFKTDVATINVALGKDLGNPGILFRIQLAAREAANSEKHAGCSRPSEQIVEWGVGHARRWSEQIESIRKERGG